MSKTKSIFSGTAAYGLLEIMETLKTQSGGRLMTNQSREFLKSMTPLIINATSPPNGASPQDRADAEKARKELQEMQRSLLEPPWRMGVSIRNAPNGVVVERVDPNGPAASAGINVGDLILQFNSENLVSDDQSFKWKVANSDNPTIKLKIRKRSGQEVESNVPLSH